MKLYGEQRKTKDERRCKGSKLEGKSGGLGEVPGFGGKVGTYQISTTGTDSYRRDSFVDRESPDERIAGKFLSQLIEETEYQLAYYEKQTSLTRERLKELKHFHKITNNNE